MFTCLYVAGILFMTDGIDAVPINSDTKIHLERNQVAVGSDRSNARWFIAGKDHNTVQDVLWECDRQATEAVMMRSW